MSVTPTQNYYLLYRSVTYAKQACGTLYNIGIPCGVARAAAGMSANGCAHTVRVPANRFQDALIRLKLLGQYPKTAFRLVSDGKFEQITLPQ